MDTVEVGFIALACAVALGLLLGLSMDGGAALVAMGH
jgi:hypothetical protein